MYKALPLGGDIPRPSYSRNPRHRDDVLLPVGLQPQGPAFPLLSTSSMDRLIRAHLGADIWHGHKSKLAVQVASVVAMDHSYYTEPVVAAAEEDGSTHLVHLLELSNHVHIVPTRGEVPRKDCGVQVQGAGSLSKAASTLLRHFQVVRQRERMGWVVGELVMGAKAVVVGSGRYVTDMGHVLTEDMAVTQREVVAAGYMVVDGRGEERPRLARHMDLVLVHYLVLRV
jgi:hypothetical protein